MSGLHVMLDIEAFGKAPNGCLVEIGAMGFTTSSLSPMGFHTYIHPGSSEAAGMVLDADTVGWWFEKGGYKFSYPQSSLPSALQLLNDRYEWEKLEGVWTNSPLYDFAILRRAYELVGLPLPWHYRQERCCRTLFWAARKRSDSFQLPQRTTPRHDALADATYQAHVTIYLLNILKVS